MLSRICWLSSSTKTMLLCLPINSTIRDFGALLRISTKGSIVIFRIRSQPICSIWVISPRTRWLIKKLAKWDCFCPFDGWLMKCTRAFIGWAERSRNCVPVLPEILMTTVWASTCWICRIVPPTSLSLKSNFSMWSIELSKDISNPRLAVGLYCIIQLDIH